MLCFSLILFSQEEEGYRYEFPESWEEAKQLSKESNKPILLYQTFWISSTNPKLDAQVFRNKAIMDSISKEFVVYEAPKRVEPRERLYEKFPCVYGNYFTITNHENDLIYQFTGYSTIEKLFAQLEEYKKDKPIQEYYDVYEKNKTDSIFMYNFVGALLDQYVNDKEVFNYYLDHFFEINDHCKKILCRELVDERSSRMFMNHYFEFQVAGYPEKGLVRRLMNSVVYDFEKEHGYRFGRSGDRYKDNGLLFEMTRSFLGESESFKSPYLANTKYSISKKEYETNPNEKNKKAYVQSTLDLYKFNAEKIIGEYQLFKITYDLFLMIDERNDMDQLIHVLETKEEFKEEFEYVEILALCYYRLDDENETVKLLAKANELAVAQGIKFRPVLSKLRANGNIGKMEKTSRKN